MPPQPGEAVFSAGIRKGALVRFGAGEEELEGGVVSFFVGGT